MPARPLTVYTDTNVTNGTMYYYVVSAVNSGGEGANSTEVSATPQPPPPAARAGLTATPGDSQIVLNWNAASGATAYNVKRSTVSGSGYVTNASLTATNYTDITVTNGTLYYYVVSAMNSGGEGPDSLEVSARPVSLSPPQLVSGVSGGQIQLSWPADHLGWTLQVQTNDLSAGLGTNWISIPASATNTQFAAPLAPENPCVFYRLIH